MQKYYFDVKHAVKHLWSLGFCTISNRGDHLSEKNILQHVSQWMRITKYTSVKLSPAYFDSRDKDCRNISDGQASLGDASMI